MTNTIALHPSNYYTPQRPTFWTLSIISYSSGTIFGHLSKPCSKYARKRLIIGHSLAEESKNEYLYPQT